MMEPEPMSGEDLRAWLTLRGVAREDLAESIRLNLGKSEEELDDEYAETCGWIA